MVWAGGMSGSVAIEPSVRKPDNDTSPKDQWPKKAAILLLEPREPRCRSRRSVLGVGCYAPPAIAGWLGASADPQRCNSRIQQCQIRRRPPTVLPVLRSGAALQGGHGKIQR